MNDKYSESLLKNYRIVSLALNVPGPVAAFKLMKFGIEVIKVEPPKGDPLNILCPSWYKELTENQNILNLNLKESVDREKLDVILDTADILLTSFRPQALERLNLNWSSIHNRFPKLSQVAIVGYRSPYSNKPGHDLTYLAKLGLVNPPNLPNTLLADLAGAEQAINCILKLLLLKEKLEVGVYEEVSLAEAAEMFSMPFLFGLTKRSGILGGSLPYYNLYRTKDGWIALAALEEIFQKRLKSVLSIQDLQYEELSKYFISNTGNYWEKWAKENDIPLATLEYHDS